MEQDGENLDFCQQGPEWPLYEAWVGLEVQTVRGRYSTILTSVLEFTHLPKPLSSTP